MARPRKTSKTVVTNEVASPAVEPQANAESSANNNTDRRMKMPLSPDEVRAIYANRRTKGLYDTLLVSFLESGDNGVSVKDEWSELADKKAATLKQGFENSKDRKTAPEGAENVDVIVDGDNVYLINKVIAGIEDTDAVVTDEEEALV